jgi:hypothetical protein
MFAIKKILFLFLVLLIFHVSISILIFKVENYNKYYIIRCYCHLNDTQLVTKSDINALSAFVCFSVNAKIIHRLNNNNHYNYIKLLFIILLCGDIELNPGYINQIDSDINSYCQQFNKLKGIKIMHFNARSIGNKIDEFRILCVKFRPNILCITETWTKPDLDEYLFRIDGYILHQKFRADGNGGGVAIYVKTNSNFIVNRVFEETNLELLCLEVKQTNCKSFLITCVYRPANRDECFWEDFENFLNYFSKKEVIILGDFNIDSLNPINKSWLKAMKDKNLTQLIKCPTRISQTSSSCIDHIYSNKTENISGSGVLDINLSDHKAIYVSRKLNFMKKYRKDS